MITITVVRPAGRDGNGDPLPGGGEHTIENVPVAPRTADESGQTVIVGLTIFPPFGSDLKSTDQVRIDEAAWAGTYDVVGVPGQWQSPYSGRRAGMEVALTRTG